MKQEKIIDPLCFWAPVICTVTLVISVTVMLVATKVGLLKVLLHPLLSLIWFIFWISGVGGLACLVILLRQHNLKNYFDSLILTADFHESAKIYPKYSDFKEKQQHFSTIENSFNSCVRSSYVWKSSKSIRFVIQTPRNGDVRELFNKKASNLREDIAARYSQYSFSNFAQIGNFYVLEGSC